jgi:hypothetical protein
MRFINTNVEMSSGSLPDGRLVEAFRGNDYKYGPKGHEKPLKIVFTKRLNES